MKKIITILLFFPILVYSQTDTIIIKDNNVHTLFMTRKSDSKGIFKSEYYYRKTTHHYSEKKEYSIIKLDSKLLSFDPSLIEIKEINFSFHIQNTGFIYGSGKDKTGGLYPFILRSENAGVTWIPVKEFNNLKANFKDSHFYMFNDKKAILFIDDFDSNSSFNYAITEDAGKTWEMKTLNIDKKIPPGHQIPLNVAYSPDGKVTLLITLPDPVKYKINNIVVLQSIDFGLNFKELK